MDERNAPLPKPFVIDADVIGDDVIVQLRVFGAAIFWAAQAKDALLMALSGGLSLRSDGRHHAVFEPQSATLDVIDGLAPLQLGADLVLKMLTPLAIRNGATVGLSPRSLVSSLIARATGLSRWQGYSLQLDSYTARRRGGSVSLEGGNLYPVYFQRHSRRQPGRDFPVMGLAGRLQIRGDLAELAPLFAIGAVAHIGSHAALGLGRCDVIAYR